MFITISSVVAAIFSMILPYAMPPVLPIIDVMDVLTFGQINRVGLLEVHTTKSFLWAFLDGRFYIEAPSSLMGVERTFLRKLLFEQAIILPQCDSYAYTPQTLPTADELCRLYIAQNDIGWLGKWYYLQNGLQEPYYISHRAYTHADIQVCFVTDLDDVRLLSKSVVPFSGDGASGRDAPYVVRFQMGHTPSIGDLDFLLELAARTAAGALFTFCAKVTVLSLFGVMPIG